MPRNDARRSNRQGVMAERNALNMVNAINIPQGPRRSIFPNHTPYEPVGIIRDIQRGNVGVKRGQYSYPHGIGNRYVVFDPVEEARVRSLAVRTQGDKMKSKMTDSVHKIELLNIPHANRKISQLNRHITQGPLIEEFPTEPPSMKKGGIVPKDGVYRLHKGEKVIPTKNKK